jgi:cation transport ATPase
MKIPTAKGDPEALRAIADSFNGVPGVESVSINPTTGSLLLKYDSSRHVDVHAGLGARAGADYQPPETDIDKTADAIAREAEFLAEHSHAARLIVDFFTLLDRELKLRTDNFVDLKIVLAAGIIAGTVFELGMLAATPVWLTLAVFTINHMVQLHQHQLMREATGTGAPA